MYMGNVGRPSFSCFSHHSRLASVVSLHDIPVSTFAVPWKSCNSASNSFTRRCSLRSLEYPPCALGSWSPALFVPVPSGSQDRGPIRPMSSVLPSTHCQPVVLCPLLAPSIHLGCILHLPHPLRRVRYLRGTYLKSGSSTNACCTSSWKVRSTGDPSDSAVDRFLIAVPTF